MPGKDGPPYAMIPSYITEFQSSPVRICGGRNKWNKNDKNHEENHVKTRPDQTRVIYSIITWNTVSRDWGKLSKVLRRVSSKLNFPPKSCMPSREKMMMKRKSRSNREAMERTEFSREATRLDREFQYLRKRHPVNIWVKQINKYVSVTNTQCAQLINLCSPFLSHFFLSSARLYILRTFGNTIAAIVFHCPVLQYVTFKHELVEGQRNTHSSSAELLKKVKVSVLTWLFWRFLASVRNVTQRCREETWSWFPPEWSQEFLHTRRSCQSDWRARQSMPVESKEKRET